MRTKILMVMVMASSMARAGVYDARKTELTTWVDAAQFTDPKQKDSVKSSMNSYCSQMDSAIENLGRALEPGGSDYARKWSDNTVRARDAFLTFQKAMSDAASTEANATVKTDLLRLATEEQAFITQLTATDDVGKAADQLVAVRKELEDQKSKVVGTKFPEFLRNASEFNRAASQAYGAITRGTDVFKTQAATTKANSRDAVQGGIQTIMAFLGKALSEMQIVKSRWQTWDGRVNELRRTHNDAIPLIARAICEGDSEEEMARLGDAIEEQVQLQVQSVYNDVKATGESISSSLASIAASSTTTKAEALKLKEEVDKKLRSIELTREKGLLRGSLRPESRTKAAYGTAKHQTLRGSCPGASELTVDGCTNPETKGGTCIIDCVRAGSTCQIVEYKPKGANAERKGIQKAYAERNAVYDRFKNATSIKDPLFNGKWSVFTSCFTDGTGGSPGTLRLDAALETYDFCPIDESAISVILSW